MGLVGAKVVVPASGGALGIHGLLEADAELLAYGLELLEVFFVLRLVLDLHLNTCGFVSAVFFCMGCKEGRMSPSKIRTAVGKSLTRLAARRAAMMTEGEGTRS